MSKRLKKAYSIFDRSKCYSIDEALDFVFKYDATAKAKFDESIDISIRLGVDQNKPDQIIRSFVELPNGNGKKSKVLVFANDDNINKALKAGAAYAGSDELISQIENGSINDFDKCVSTVSMMPKVAKIAKILGPRGLMPNPKMGTVVDGDVTPIVTSLVKGRSDIKTEKDGSVKLSIGRISFGKDKIVENLKEVASVIKQVRPSSVKADYITDVFINTTMGIGIKVRVNEIYSI